MIKLPHFFFITDLYQCRLFVYKVSKLSMSKFLPSLPTQSHIILVKGLTCDCYVMSGTPILAMSLSVDGCKSHHRGQTRNKERVTFTIFLAKSFFLLATQHYLCMEFMLLFYVFLYTIYRREIYYITLAKIWVDIYLRKNLKLQKDDKANWYHHLFLKYLVIFSTFKLNLV